MVRYREKKYHNRCSLFYGKLWQCNSLIASLSGGVILFCGIFLVAGMFFLCDFTVVASEKVPRSEVMIHPVGIESLMDTEKSDDEILAEAENMELFGYKNLGIANVENNLNVRAKAAENSSLVGKMPKDSACEIVGQEGDWTKMKSGKVEGYVKTEFLFTGSAARIKAMELISTYAVVHADALRVRKEPNTEASIYTQVAQGEMLEYVRTLDNGWVEIMLDDETVYVAGEYVELEEQLGTAVTMSELLYGAGVSDIRVSICEYAKQFLGNRYVFGGTSLTKGTDCSGFTMRVFEKFGIRIPRNSRAQAGVGTKIKAADAKPGDLFFYGGKGGYINHVALYIGGGQVIHASSPKTGIRISNCNYRTPVKVVRIIQS